MFLMPHECDTCGQTFRTLTKKRLHDCSGRPAELHDLPDDLADGLPDRFLTMDEAAELDEYGTERFFPLLALGGYNASGKVIAGYAKTSNGHFLLAFNGNDESWYVIEKNAETASFEKSLEDLTWYVCERGNVDPTEPIAYDSGDPEYPDLDA